MSDFKEIFGPQGPLQGALAGFRARSQQALMAERVGFALERSEALIVEAGTGTGKTFAYLVPALLSGARVLISTGTRALRRRSHFIKARAARKLFCARSAEMGL